MNSKFHPGERAMQAQAGETAMADRNSKLLANTVMAGARPFINQQFMAVLGSTDAEGQVWASMVFGRPGFLHTGDGSTITLDLPEQERDQADPLWANLADRPELGMLFIELGSRRRYRVNGALQRLDARGMELAVREAFPNCPKHIQRRHLRRLGEPALPVRAVHGTVLDGVAAGLVARADTAFVASRHDGGTDVSHRGGNPGFIELVDNTTLRIPDYHGNSMFNTLGNFLLDPHAGLCIPDFVHGQLLQLTGAATVHWNQDDPANQTGGTGRYWEFKIAQWILRDTPQPLAWEYQDASPFNPVPGNSSP